MKKIKFDLNGDNRPFIEGIESYNDSMFQDQYEQCVNLIESYLKGLSGMEATTVSLRYSLENCNNIIVFDGERGSGKTSCMLSMVNMLTQDNHCKLATPDKYVSQRQFVTIPMLDPSFFDNEHNVLSLFVSSLYSAYREWDLDPHNKLKDNKKKGDLIESFVLVQKELQSIFGDKKAEDGLEYLVNMAAAVEIRKDIHELVSNFLAYIGKENAILLLAIDDIDIDSVNAYPMCEQLRKYFMQPNMVVLMSLKIDQLSDIICRKYAMEYGVKFGIDNQKADYSSVVSDITERAERYLAKLLPAHQRIYMPKPDEFLDFELIVPDSEKWSYKLVGGIRVKQVIPELIFIKTRYLFYNSVDTVSYIVPRNLRDLRQLLKLLVQMPDYADETEESPHYYNKKVFQQYLFNDWCDINLTENYKGMALKAISVEKTVDFNHEIMNLLLSINSNPLEIYRSNTEDSYLDNICDNLNLPYNQSISDVLCVMRAIGKTKLDEPTRKFLFFLRSLYGIKLYHAYDTITSSREDNARKKELKPNVTIQKKMHSLVGNDYEALISGRVFDGYLDSFVPNAKTDPFVVYKSSLLKVANYCVQIWDLEDAKALSEMLELVMLSIYCDWDKAHKIQGNHRRYPALCYDSISVDADRYIFDIGALFFNLARPDASLKRFEVIPELKAFFDKLNESKTAGKHGLLEALKAKTRENRGKRWKKDKEQWLSFCCFRNMEIMEDFLDTVRETKYTDTTDLYLTVHELLKAAGQYKISSYDRFNDSSTGEDDKPYDISFSFFSIIAESFSSDKVNVKTNFESLFKSSETEGIDGKNAGNTSPERTTVMSPSPISKEE